MKIAVSACLLGEPCRYDGASKPHDGVRDLGSRCEFVPVCPEQLGGLPTPRVPSEVQMAQGRPDRVVNAAGEDVTAAFALGAREALRIARDQGCAVALLKAKSPSCGRSCVYDGTFSGTLTEGSGVAARLFRDQGIAVFDEGQVDDVRRLVAKNAGAAAAE